MHNLYCKNVENHAIFVEGFWPEFYARGRFMKYSMSVLWKELLAQTGKNRSRQG